MDAWFYHAMMCTPFTRETRSYTMPPMSNAFESPTVSPEERDAAIAETRGRIIYELAGLQDDQQKLQIIEARLGNGGIHTEDETLLVELSHKYGPRYPNGDGQGRSAHEKIAALREAMDGIEKTMKRLVSWDEHQGPEFVGRETRPTA